MTLLQQIEHIYRLIGDSRIETLGLLRIKDDALATPFADDALLLFDYRSKRANEGIAQPVIEKLIAAIRASNGFAGLNHVGFCYKVASMDDEVKRIASRIGGTKFGAYQEPSIDGAPWIFVGDLSDIANPCLEFLPHDGRTTDKWVDYWLPHIQFDIDTGLSPDEIEVLVRRFVDRPFTPYPFQIDGVTYIQRVNLGCVEGINLFLDIATNNRNINYRKTWNRLG